MKLALLIPLLVSLTGCGTASIEHVASADSVPVPPALTQSLVTPCPELNQLSDKAIGTLVIEDANAATDYAGCATKHGEVAGLYLLWRQKILDFIAELRNKEPR